MSVDGPLEKKQVTSTQLSCCSIKQLKYNQTIDCAMLFMSQGRLLMENSCCYVYRTIGDVHRIGGSVVADKNNGGPSVYFYPTSLA